MATLELAIKTAVDAHRGQTDKTGAPYIFHPLAVMMDPELRTDDERIVAVLHDVVEDAGRSAADLARLGFSDPVIDAVLALTKRKGEDYGHYLARVLANPIAHQVKKADVRHNSAPGRLGALTEADRKRLMHKYDRARLILGMERS